MPTSIAPPAQVAGTPASPDAPPARAAHSPHAGAVETARPPVRAVPIPTPTAATARSNAPTDAPTHPPKTRPSERARAEVIPPWVARANATPAPVSLPKDSRASTGKAGRAARKGNAQPADSSTRSMRVIEWLTERLPPKWRARTREYLVLMRMDRPVGALLLLWPTWWGLWAAAKDFPPVGMLVVFTLGVFVMRSAGCVINDYADHGWLDAHVERTRGRPMAAGRVSRREALSLFAGLLAFAFVLVLFTNTLTILLSFGGAALAAIYPFTKRWTHLAQVVLGAAFGWSIPMAFAAVTGEVPALAWLLFLANVLFSTIYDTEYAMVDRDDDLRVGAKSTAILFGDADRPILGVLMVTFLLAMLLVGTRLALGWPYWLALAASAGLFAWQQWLIRARDRAECLAAFRNNNVVGCVLWLGLLLALAIR